MNALIRTFWPPRSAGRDGDGTALLSHATNRVAVIGSVQSPVLGPFWRSQDQHQLERVSELVQKVLATEVCRA